MCGRFVAYYPGAGLRITDIFNRCCGYPTVIGYTITKHFVMWSDHNLHQTLYGSFLT